MRPHARSTSVIYEESADEARQFAQSALEAMAKAAVPPNPANFRLWYEYAGKRNASLTRVMDDLVKQGTTFDDATCLDLFERFFGAARNELVVNEVSRSVQENLTVIHTMASDANGGAARYNAVLRQVHEELKSGGEIAESAIERAATETEEMVKLSQQVGARLAESISEIARLRSDLEAVRRESMTDPVTGLPNRNYFDLALVDSVQQATARREDLSLMVIEIDDFKGFTQARGAGTGDQMLALVGRVLKENLKDTDIATRYGPQEFAVLLPKTKLSNALTIGHVLREALKRKKLVKKTTGEEIGRITVSIGASGHAIGEPQVEMVRRGELALASAKGDGGNRIVSQDSLDTVVEVKR
jgi:diguanylate cyclase